MKPTAYSAIHKLSFIVMMLSFISFRSDAQIKIKERVEISPKNIEISFAKSRDFTLPALDPNDFALYGNGGFIESYDNIYEDKIFVPRVGGIIGIAYDDKYLNGTPFEPWYNSLYVFGPSGNTKKVFPFSDFIDANEEWNKYAFSQEKYEQDRDNAHYWAEHDPNYIADPTKWGYYPVTRMFLPVKAWEPLRFRYYYYKDWDEGTFVSPIDNPDYNLFTDYPNLMLFPSLGTGVGQLFRMHWESYDSSAIGELPIIYLDSPPEFYLPDSGMYRVVIGSVLSRVNGTLSVIDTTTHVLVTDIRNHQGDTVLLGPYAEGTVLKFDLDGMLQYGGQDDYASGGIGFEGWIDYDFQDASLWFEYAAGTPDHLELWSSSETIYYGDTVDVDIVPCDSDSLFSPLGNDYKYEFSVELTGETSQYVELIYNDQGSTLVEHIPSENRRGLGVRLAANKLEPDSVVNLTFRLKAFYIGGGGVASSIATVPNNQSEIKVLAKKSSITQSKRTVSSKDGKITLSFGKQKKEINRFGSKKLQAMSATKHPKKRKIGHSIIAEKSKNVLSASYSNKAISASIMDEEPSSAFLDNLCSWGESPTPELKVYPIEGDDNTQKIEGTNPPHMPQPVIVAQLRNFKGGSVQFEWNMKIEWTKARQGWDRKNQKWIVWNTPHNSSEFYHGYAWGRNSEFEDLDIKQDIEKYGIRGGDKVTLHVEAMAGGKKYNTPDITNPFIVKGLNPSLPIILAELNGLEYEAIARQESNFNQFGLPDGPRACSQADYPLQGESDPGDFGIMQKHLYENTSGNDDIIWNWKENVSVCKDYYDICYNNAKAYLNNSFEGAGPYDDNGELLIEAFCQYNGGSSANKKKGRHYYKWKEPDPNTNESGSWVRIEDDPDQRVNDARDYGDKVWDLWNTPNWR
jgi:hypothetical protein